MVLPQIIKKLEYKLCSTRNIRVPKFLWLVDFQIQNFFHFNKGTAWNDSTLNKTMANSSLNSVKRIVYYDEKKDVSTEIVIEEVHVLEGFKVTHTSLTTPWCVGFGRSLRLLYLALGSCHGRIRLAWSRSLCWCNRIGGISYCQRWTKKCLQKKKIYRLEQVLRSPHSF